MKKIISLYQRNYETDRLVRDEVVPGAEWVLAGEGVATRKYDGTCCLVNDGRLYKRYDAKKGKTPPASFVPAQPEPDPISGHWPGWLPVGDGPEDQHHREAWTAEGRCPLADGTYELCGPKVQGNAEWLCEHLLIPHGCDLLPDVPRDYAGIKAYLAEHDIEGIVWWRNNDGGCYSDENTDCDMVKIKAKDFGIERGGR